MTGRADRSFMARWRARRYGERDARDLEVLSAAGRSVYEELDWADRNAERLALDGYGRWEIPVGPASHALASWVAFVLHSVGEGLLLVDYADKPKLAGFVPPRTFELAWECLVAVEGWLSLARQGRADPDFDLRLVVEGPAGLPHWDPSMWYRTDETVHATHSGRALQKAIEVIRPRAEYLVFLLGKEPVPDSGRLVLSRLRQRLTGASSTADYWNGVDTGSLTARSEMMAARELYRAIGVWLEVGQLTAFPLPFGTAHTGDMAPAPDLAYEPLPADPEAIAVPFDLDDPPFEPPPNCADEVTWRLARGLFDAHQLDALSGRCRCGRMLPCTGQRLAAVGLVAAYLCGPGTPWPHSLHAMQRRMLADTG
jgi:hypothetical protein